MSPLHAARRLRFAETELHEAERDGRARDVAAWRIAVDVLRHFAATDPAGGPYPAAPGQPSLRS